MNENEQEFEGEANRLDAVQRTPRAVAPEPWNAGSAGAAVSSTGTMTSLAALLTGHILQDGEVILLILKPSMWFIVLSMLRSGAVVVILMLAGKVYDDQLPGNARSYFELGTILLAARVMWSLLQWFGKLYILTDMRIIRLSGIFTLDLFDCPLRKIARTRLLYTVRERMFGLATIEIIPADEKYPIGTWQTVAHPVAINDQIVAAINRAKGRSCGNAA